MSQVSTALQALDAEVVLAVARKISGDGWTIFPASEFVELGVPVDTLAHFIQRHDSDRRSPKSTISRGGEAVDSATGVYGLTLIEALAYNLVPNYSCDKSGRGFTASEASSALIRHFSKEKSDERNSDEET
jgi:hypothetical protein